MYVLIVIKDSQKNTFFAQVPKNDKKAYSIDMFPSKLPYKY